MHMGPKTPPEGDVFDLSLEVDANTTFGGVPPPREKHPDLGDGGYILASNVTGTSLPTPKSRILFPL
eukprot:3453678-Pyramimonas_sp.AAC.1